ncbi:hypothetical protein EF834_15190 [Rhodococcus spongiicola]|uniref:Uncharacterized protein n=1 Tax=Rhodococcus spongiicola TaxID=2487352 RepID=A0A3S3A4A9_9NOCA|nr:hypothetical protein EF834_15190 [Rhodococcus spongiicola]
MSGGRARSPPDALDWDGRAARLRPCVAAGIPPVELAGFMEDAKVTTTPSVYAHLFADDHCAATASLGATAGSSMRPAANRSKRCDGGCGPILADSYLPRHN